MKRIIKIIWGGFKVLILYITGCLTYTAALTGFFDSAATGSGGEVGAIAFCLGLTTIFWSLTTFYYDEIKYI